MEFGKSNWRTYDRGIEKEWLLTNGIGGYSSSTMIGANTRRYHGLLIASLKPPVNRHLILSKIDESLTINGEVHPLYSFQTPDYTMEGFKYLQRFVKNPLPTYLFSIKDAFIEKKISMIYGENTVVIVYRIFGGENASTLRLTPLVNFRDHHFNASRQHMDFVQTTTKDGVSIKPYHLDLDIQIFCSQGKYIPKDNDYFMNMDYAVERERGLHPTEDHYIPGYFEVEAAPGKETVVTVVATIEKEIKRKDGPALIQAEEKRLQQLIDKAGYEDPLAQRLVLAADQFIVHRSSTDSKTIIAGYPWFTDWGRDTMIALPGVTLSTKRFDDAKNILYTFSRYVKYGLVPNVFPDGGDEPPYNSVDASLWYFEAVYKYIQYTGDERFIFDHIYSALDEIIQAFRQGTIFKIKMDTDHLVSAGDPGTQLTWMDAKVGDWVVTPRHGKAVEINALWYNALRIFADLSKRLGKENAFYEELAEKVRQSFEKSFWNEEEQCLFDVITGESRDDSIRPNQIMAVSLSYPVLNGHKARKVVERVWTDLYTAYGLRSLSQKSKEYVGIYYGDQVKRDGAYHQGTVWTWLLGQFITAYVRVNGNSEEAQKMAMRFIEPFNDHLEDAGLGSISEIFDGNEPLIPRGCFAQAWSVGEILRAYAEDVLVR
ncbi:MAG: amylo-alpha-1,6-glucosidase [Clostridia bacterium]|nr:amylo-alpha-1,6-glucosidase [Clostridia bacterium]